MKINGNCFVNNTANNYGGAIYVGTETSYTLIDDSTFISAEISSTLLSGIFIQSHSKTIVITDSNRNISAIYHSKESTKRSLITGDLTIQCPVNTKLVLYNTTSNIESPSNIGPVSDWLHFNDLVYTCEQCGIGYYSLYSGYFKHIPEIIKGRRKR